MIIEPLTFPLFCLGATHPTSPALPHSFPLFRYLEEVFPDMMVPDKEHLYAAGALQNPALNMCLDTLSAKEAKMQAGPSLGVSFGEFLRFLTLSLTLSVPRLLARYISVCRRQKRKPAVFLYEKLQ